MGRLVNNGVRNSTAYSSMATSRAGLVFGVYSDEDKLTLSPEATEYDNTANNWLSNILPLTGKSLSAGSSAVVYNPGAEHSTVCLVGLGSATTDAQKDKYEGRDLRKQRIREATAVGCRALRDVGVTSIAVESCGDAEAASEGVSLGLYSYDALKQEKTQHVNATLLGKTSSASWELGKKLGEGQNIARDLMEAPANLMTPTIFAKEAAEVLRAEGVTVTAHDEAWATAKGMHSFLSVGRGSEEPSIFLEISYKGSNKSCTDLALVGKGVTFDSGGISIKPSKDMDQMKADMGGAAAVVATITTLAKLKLPINVAGYIPLVENMPSGHATKPGDVVTAMNGKTIQVDNTDAEGRLILADALTYASLNKPNILIDTATLTGAIGVALGNATCGVFTNSDKIWELLHTASHHTGDRVWRMPLWQHYVKAMEHGVGDLNNLSKDGKAGACTAAGFLSQFITPGTPHWAHLDIAGVRPITAGDKLLKGGMSGRPTRTFIQFARLLAKQSL